MLAREVTGSCTGATRWRAPSGPRRCSSATTRDANVEDVLAVFDDVPSSEIAGVPAEGIALAELLLRRALAPSKSEARRLVQARRRVCQQRPRRG